MNAEVLQNLLLLLILLISSVVALRHLSPHAFRRMQTGIARVLSNRQRHRVLQRWGYRLQPNEAKEGGCGSGLGCGSCSGCGSGGSETVAAISLKFKPRS
jgi:hypothetical protein